MLVNRLFKEKKYKNIYDYLNYLNNLSEQLS